jgi:S-adenosylhomocysteine hydrolase
LIPVFAERMNEIDLIVSNKLLAFKGVLNMILDDGGDLTNLVLDNIQTYKFN